MPTKQVDDLLVRVTIAIIHDHFGFKVPAGVQIGFLFRDFRHFCRGKRAHTVFKECSIVPMGYNIPQYRERRFERDGTLA